jgi:hypothetical protein
MRVCWAGLGWVGLGSIGRDGSGTGNWKYLGLEIFVYRFPPSEITVNMLVHMSVCFLSSSLLLVCALLIRHPPLKLSSIYAVSKTLNRWIVNIFGPCVIEKLAYK